MIFRSGIRLAKAFVNRSKFRVEAVHRSVNESLGPEGLRSQILNRDFPLSIPSFAVESSTRLVNVNARRQLLVQWLHSSRESGNFSNSMTSKTNVNIPTASFSLLALNEIRDRPGSRKKRMRVGRGIGSGKGKTAGRGHKGQKSRSGRNPRIGFEGGQTPLRLTLPKRGFHNPFKLEFQVVNLDSIAEKINEGKIDTTQVITMKSLKDAKLGGKSMRDGIKLLGRGANNFSHKINIEVSRVSETAKEAIEALGGTVTRVHYNKLGLRALLKPEWFVKKKRLLPRPARTPLKLLDCVDRAGTLPPPLSIYGESPPKKLLLKSLSF